MAKVIYSLIKVTDKREFAASFRDGLLHFRKVKTFQDFEKPSDSQRHDTYEGVIAAFQPKQVLIKFNNIEIDRNGIIGPILVHDNSLLDRYVFCMYSLDSKGWDAIPEDQVESFKSDMKINSNIQKFGDYATVILNVREFLNRVQAAVQSKGYGCRMGLVEYYDVKEVNGIFTQAKFGFQKHDRLRPQNEFRIIIDSNPTDNDYPWDFNIGSIADISGTIPTWDLQKSFQMEIR